MPSATTHFHMSQSGLGRIGHTKTNARLFDAAPGNYIDGIRFDLYDEVRRGPTHDPTEPFRGGRRIYDPRPPRPLRAILPASEPEGAPLAA